MACCSWDRTPAAEVLPGTAQAWIEGLVDGRSWEQSRDVPRIRAAFRTLVTTCDRWPSPKQFLDALPRVEQKALGYDVKPLSREEADARMASIRRMLNEPMPSFKPEPEPETTPEQRTALEHEARERYRGMKHDGRAAAAGDDARTDA